MKTLFLTCLLSSLLGLTTSLAQAQDGSDCYIRVSTLQVEHNDCFGFSDPNGLCSTWGSEQVLYAAMTRSAPNRYEITNSDLQLRASATINGNNAHITLEAPGLNKDTTIATTPDSTSNEVKDGSYDTDTKNYFTQKGMSYSISCTFGLTDLVAQLNASDEKKMDEMGPSAEWSDPSAPSLAVLPIGTTLTLNRDLDIAPGTDTATTMIVEENGLMTEGAFFDALELPFRFAYAEFFDANNEYINPAHYARGLQLEVVAVQMHRVGDKGQEYDILFKNTQNAADPIVRMQVDGRRSAASDMKIPEFVEMLKPVFTVSLGK